MSFPNSNASITDSLSKLKAYNDRNTTGQAGPMPPQSGAPSDTAVPRSRANPSDSRAGRNGRPSTPQTPPPPTFFTLQMGDLPRSNPWRWPSSISRP
jgi:hypothetical protein